MSTKTIDVDQTHESLADLLSLAAQGTEVIVTRAGTPLARIVPIEPPPAHRVAGLHPGAIEVGDDFDEPLPEEFWTGAS